MQLPSVKNAFFIHTGISLVIFLTLVIIMRLIWYPGNLFFVDGGIQGLKILAPIDLVLGPALTLLFYRPWKKSVAVDMCCIATVQLAALSYGVHLVHQQRPVALVFAEKRFESISANTVDAANKELRAAGITPTPLTKFGSQSPVVIYAQSFNKDEYGDYLASLLNGMPELRERSDRYRLPQQGRAEIEKYRQTTSTSGTSIEVPASYSDKTASTEEGYYLLKGRYGDARLVLDQTDLKLLRVVAGDNQ